MYCLIPQELVRLPLLLKYIKGATLYLLFLPCPVVWGAVCEVDAIGQEHSAESLRLHQLRQRR